MPTGSNVARGHVSHYPSPATENTTATTGRTRLDSVVSDSAMQSLVPLLAACDWLMAGHVT